MIWAFFRISGQRISDQVTPTRATSYKSSRGSKKSFKKASTFKRADYGGSQDVAYSDVQADHEGQEENGEA